MDVFDYITDRMYGLEHYPLDAYIEEKETPVEVLKAISIVDDYNCRLDDERHLVNVAKRLCCTYVNGIMRNSILLTKEHLEKIPYAFDAIETAVKSYEFSSKNLRRDGVDILRKIAEKAYNDFLTKEGLK